MATTFSGGSGSDSLLGGTYTVRAGRQSQMAGVDPRLVDILQTAAAVAPPSIGTVEAFSGRTGRSTGTRNHPAGLATDVQIYGPNGEPYAKYVGNPFGAKAKANTAAYQAYEQFAQVARQVQEQKYPELNGAFRWGGYFKGGVNPGDLMHFDLSGGRSPKTPPQTEAWAKGIGNGITLGAAALTAPVDIASAAPTNAQSAIASLIAPSGGSSIPDMPTAAQGYAPNLPGNAPPPPQMPQIASAAPPRPPAAPPQWAQASGFPIDEALTGRSGQDVLAGGPRQNPRTAVGSAPIAPDMGSMRSAEDVLAAGPRMRPPLDVNMPLPQARPDLPARFRPGPGGALGVDLGTQAAGIAPPMRPGGAPDAATVPTPPPRAQGIPNPPPRGTPYAPTFPELYGQQPPPLAGGMSAAMGNAPPPAAFNPLSSANPGNRPPPPAPDANIVMNALDMAQSRKAFEGPFGAGNLRPQASPPPGPPRTGNVNYAGPLPTQRLPQTQAAVNVPGMGLGPYGMTPPPPSGPFFDNANPGPTFTPPGAMASNITIPKSPFEGSTGTGFTPPPPKPPSIAQSMRDQFNVAFSPGQSGQIMDLQTAFNNRFGAPPTMTAQDGINSVFGAPPAAATPPNLAVPFNEVAGAAPANAANVTSPFPKPPTTTWGDTTNIKGRFDDAFGPTAPTTPTAGVTPGVVSGQMPQPMDIRSPAQMGVVSPVPTPPPATQPPPAQTQQTRAPFSMFPGLLGRGLNTIAPGLFPNAGQARGPISGGILGMLAARNPPNFTPGGRSGVGINSSTGGPAAYQHGSVGNMGAMQYQTSDGRTVVTAVDPFTGASITGYV